ncbi:2,3-diaminopropionate biosynthesis protein SbnB [Postechiella marina]|uniref:2,3-diaminopropionate biosynthesis protein SbnB n=1 Tax=Postechiella marina TaxID=943941 RepID=A0ABP8CC13_9FLAO
MKYLNENALMEIGIDWNQTISVIDAAVSELRASNFAQPVKPYLRYGKPYNRIIAMPAYIGGNYGSAGIKWISSFPDNIKKNEKRANAVVILNDVDTGKPYCIINSGVISGIRTASVSGLLLNKYTKNQDKKFDVGIIGFGPIGKLHLDMCANLLGEKLNKVHLFDKRAIDISEIPSSYRHKVVLVNSWNEIVDKSDIVMTCTVSNDRYINSTGRKGTLHLNVSLRDYCPEFMKTVDVMLVDDWEEICRENTDIELMHLQHGLNEKDVFNIYDDFESQLDDLDNKVVMFNPMGMAVFDIAISQYYFTKANDLGIGTDLD